MMVPATRSHARPTVLLVSGEAEFARWLRGLLEPNGIALLGADTPAEAVRHSRGEAPDLILVDADPATAPSVDACRRLRAEPAVGPHTPILLATSAPPSRDELLAALRAGVWDVLDKPLDPDETLLKINAYTRPKIAADAAMAEALVDAETGLYNVHGLARQVRELGALAARAHTPFACLVVGSEPAVPDRAVARWVRVLQATARSSDVLGRLGPAEFAVVAPATGAQGARGLALRLERALGQLPRLADDTPVRLRVGYDAVENMAYAPINAIELLGRANLAERKARSGTTGA